MWPWSANKSKIDNAKGSPLSKPLPKQGVNATRLADIRPITKNKTSVEIIRETKNMLANGTRLISTRRPVTPREPKRQLYGKTSLAGRPPSAFSLRYLQFESRILPSIEPIPNVAATTDTATLNGNNGTPRSMVLRSSSLGALTVTKENDTNNSKNNGSKLPSLLLAPKTTASMDNLSASMPPRKDFHTTNDIEVQIISNDNENVIRTHPPVKPRTPRSQNINGNESLTSDLLKIPTKKKGTNSSKSRLLLRGNDILTQSSTETLLDMLKSHADIKECSEETAVHINGILTELYSRVKGARGDWRSSVLGAVYGLVECSSPKILVSVARVVLVLRVTGSNLTGACKLVFKVARNERNDSLFLSSDVPELLIDGLARASPIDDPEACVYGYGAIRFLANAVQSSSVSANNKDGQLADKLNNKNKTLAQRLVRHGVVPLMILHLQVINEAGANENLKGQPLHALFQLSGALRTLAKIPQKEFCPEALVVKEIPSVYNPQLRDSASLKIRCNNSINSKTIIESQTCPAICETSDDEVIDSQLDLAGPHLVRAAEICVDEMEVQSNLIRTLSILSEQDKCCDILAEMSARLGILMGPCPMKAQGKNTIVQMKPLGMLSRIGYIIGNIMAKSDAARIQFYNNDVAIEYLLTTLEMYATNPFGNNSRKVLKNAENDNDTVFDVLIKLIRVIANISVNEEVGYGLGMKAPLGSILLSLLLTINKYKTSLNGDMEELLMATLGAIHNLSFYQNPTMLDEATKSINQDAGSMKERVADLTAALCVTYQTGPEIAHSEVARVLGNMTRSSVARNAFCTAGGMKLLVANLSSNDFDVIGTSCGVLVNLLSDWERRAPFRELRGPLFMRDVLQRAATNNDWLLASITCQALWNYLIDTENVIGALGEEEADSISNDLLEYLDEERLFNGNQPDPAWEQFAVVAADLLERIQSSMSYNNTPCETSDEDENEPDIISNPTISNQQIKKWLQAP